MTEEGCNTNEEILIVWYKCKWLNRFFKETPKLSENIHGNCITESLIAAYDF